jgi:hypothetical protein
MAKKKRRYLPREGIFRSIVHLVSGAWQGSVTLALLELVFILFYKHYLVSGWGQIYRYLGDAIAINFALLFCTGLLALLIIHLLYRFRLFTTEINIVDMSLAVGATAVVGLKLAFFLNMTLLLSLSSWLLISVNLGLLVFSLAVGFGIYYFVSETKSIRSSPKWFRWSWRAVCLIMIIPAVTEIYGFLSTIEAT